MQEYDSMYNLRLQKIQNAVRDIIIAIGDDPDREGLKETPARVAKMYLRELFANTDVSNNVICNEVAKIFTEDDIEGIDKFGDMVIIKDIDFFSSCEHHLVTFFGKAHIGYIPSDKVIGLSKIARLVDAVSKRPQLQERLGKDIADCMEMMLQPKGIMVVIEGTHMCMVSRGVKKPGSITVTSSCRGVFKDDSATRQEFLTLIGKGK